MLMQAVLLIQDVQLLCFTVVFGLFAMQRWSDRTRVWLWSTFLANSLGAVFDLAGNHLPSWIGNGINMEMIPLSYALLNVTLIVFDRRSRRAGWISFIILLAALPFFFAWRNQPVLIHSNGLEDALIALECAITTLLLFASREKPTRAPRYVMGGFLIPFVAVEAARFILAFPLHTDPDSIHWFEITCLVFYTVNTSLLPLAFIWMMHTRLEFELVQQSILDPLTAVLNRRGLEQALDRELARFRRERRNLTVAVLDLDHFKVINDRFGHVTGDSFLTGTVELLRQQLRVTDLIGRFGGEEFVVLLPGTEAGEACERLGQVCQSIREYDGWLPGEDVSMTASIGFSNTRDRGSVSPVDLLREADSALYRAKHNGRDQVLLYEAELVRT